MNLGSKGFNLIKSFEGCKLESYKCSAGVWTLGFGSTFYEDGTPVKEGEEITQERAEELFQRTLVSYINCVNKFVKSKISQNQFDAMVSLTYNIGCGNFKKSSVLSKVNKNAKDPSIADSFLLWNKAKGKVIKGLTRRREAEKNLYFEEN